MLYFFLWCTLQCFHPLPTLDKRNWKNEIYNNEKANKRYLGQIVEENFLGQSDWLELWSSGVPCSDGVAWFSLMMATAAVVGLNAGKRLLSSSFYYSDFTEKLSYSGEQYQIAPTKNVIVAKKTTNFNHRGSSIKALRECIDGTTIPPIAEPWIPRSSPLEEETLDPETPLEALLLLQKSMLENQLELSFERPGINDMFRENTCKESHVTSSGTPARVRRINAKKRSQVESKREIPPVVTVSPELLQNRSIGYVRGMTSDVLLTHAQVVNLSRKIEAGLSLEEHKSRYLIFFSLAL